MSELLITGQSDFERPRASDLWLPRLRVRLLAVHCRVSVIQGRLSPVKPMTRTPPNFNSPLPFPFPSPSFPSHSVPFSSLALSIPLFLFPFPKSSYGSGELLGAPAANAFWVLAHLRVSKRTSWQHLTFPMTQKASFPLVYTPLNRDPDPYGKWHPVPLGRSVINSSIYSS